jgi:hypothetical protein
MNAPMNVASMFCVTVSSSSRLVARGVAVDVADA